MSKSKLSKEGVIAIDNGGENDKIKTSTSMKTYPSEKGVLLDDWTLDRYLSGGEFLVEFRGERFACGLLAEEAFTSLEMHTDSKQHIYYDLSVLLACHQFGYEVNYVVTSVPISEHRQDEKDGIATRLKGEWVVTVNNETKKFYIADVKVAPETVSAFWINQPTGKTRWLDWGSRTIGYGTVINENDRMRFLNRDSGTFKKQGLRAMGIKDDHRHAEALADSIAGKLLSKWDKTDKVIHIGGGALNRNIVNRFSSYFPNSEIIENPKLANVQGMFLLGKTIYGF